MSPHSYHLSWSSFHPTFPSSILGHLSSPLGRPFSIFFKGFIFRGRGREEETEGEKQQCVVASHMPPTGKLALNPGMCPDWELNSQPCGLQASTQSTKPHQPGQKAL